MKRYVWFLVAAAAIALLLSIAGRMGLIGGPTQQTEVGGTPDIGGDFTLVNRQGETVTNETYAGKYRLIYFGFTSCPDVCPTTLQIITLAMDDLGDAASDVLPMFVSLDPERDDPAKVDAYLKNFDPRFVGLTGSPDQVAATAKTYRIYYAKVDLPDSALGYTIDHSSFIYLMGPNGRYLTHFTHNDDPEAIAKKVREIVEG
ncbi:MAG: SCO family protein [Rhodospirillaceae bacterium]|nr:SCO family protein [Rhodospirillaceae bacterium]